MHFEQYFASKPRKFFGKYETSEDSEKDNRSEWIT